MKIATTILAAVLLWGCNSTETRTYDLTVTNESIMPVMVWLTKNGPVYEPGWKAPEELAIERPGTPEPLGGVVIPPGKTALTGPVRGQFAPGVKAILRIYAGGMTFDEILAINRDSPDRIEIVLDPGPGKILISTDGSGVKAIKVPK